MKQKHVISIFLILITVSVVTFMMFYNSNEPDEFLYDAEVQSELDSESTDYHYKTIKNVLPPEVTDKLVSLDELLNGPEELVQLINNDEKLQGAAFDALL